MSSHLLKLIIAITLQVHLCFRISTKLAMSNSMAPVDSRLAVILLAGGKGSRMKANMPKQFLPLLGKPVFMHSLDLFLKMDNVESIVIVLDESFRDEYKDLLTLDSRIIWADPGKERQDSVFNGLTQVPTTCDLVAVHDSARPLVTEKEVNDVVRDGLLYGAAVLGVPMKATVKESEDGEFVLRTIPRSRLWEIHTPQVVRRENLLRGFKKVSENNIEVTDDVSIIESLGERVRVTVGEYTNIKLTTPDDFTVAEQVLIAREKEKNQSLKYSSDREREREREKPIKILGGRGVGVGEVEGRPMPCSSETYRLHLEGRK